MLKELIVATLFFHYSGTVQGNHVDDANKALSSGNYTLAAQLYDKAIDENPQNYLAYYLKGNVENFRRHFKSAILNYAQAIKLNPMFFEARFRKAEVLLQIGEIDNSKDELNKVLEMKDHDSSKKAGEQLASIKQMENTLKRIENSLKMGRYKEVIEVSDTILKAQFLNYDLRKCRIEAFQNLGMPEQQVSELLILQQIHPQDIGLILDIHHMLYSDGKLDEVVANLRKCLNLDPEHSRCKEHFKKTRNLQKLFAKAENALEKKEFNEVLTLSDSITKLEPNIGFCKKKVNLFKCLAYSKLENHKNCIKFCGLFLKEDGNSIEALMARGNAHYSLDQMDEAKSDFSEVLRINNHHEEARQKLRSMESAGKTKRDYYAILNVSRRATKAEINTAYRSQARIWHPDMFRTEEEKKVASKKFQDINDAKSVLTDDENRRMFDSGVDPLDKDVHQNYDHGNSHQNQHFGGGKTFFNFDGFHFDFGGQDPFGGANDDGGGNRRQHFFNFG